MCIYTVYKNVFYKSIIKGSHQNSDSKTVLLPFFNGTQNIFLNMSVFSQNVFFLDEIFKYI